MSTALLDRDLEMASLNDSLASIRDGSGQVVVVEGPAGIGKSSLVSALARTARAQGVTTSLARGGPLEQEAIWGIARQLFAPIRAGDDWESLSTGTAKLAARALDSAAPEPALAGDAMHAAVHGLVWLACNLAERRPALFVVDDVHWADAASLRWLTSLARRLDELPLGVVCAVRIGEPPAAPEELAELLASAPGPSVRPRPLSVQAAETIVAGRLPGAGASFARACHAVTAGNPFLLGALLSHLVAEGITPDADTASRLSTFGPQQIARGVERQLARLPDGAGSLARALSVLGRGAPLRLAARLIRCSLPDTAELADALRGAGLVNGEHEVALAHPLIAASLYTHLGSGARALLHAEAATLLAEEGADPEHVALHLLHSEPRGDPAVVKLLRSAAAVATARGAPESAAGFLRRAVAEPPDRATLADVYVELGLARAARWQVDATPLFRGAIAVADSPPQRARVALLGARALGLAGYFEEALDLCRRGLGDGVGLQREHRERLDAELTCNASMQAHTLCDAAGAADAAADPLDLGAVNRAARAMFSGEPASTVRALLAPLLSDGRLTQEVDSLLPTTATIVLIVDDELEPALSWCRSLMDVARPRGWLVALAHASLLQSMALVRAGRIREAEPDAALAVAYKQGNTSPAALTWALHTHIDALTEADRLDDAEIALARAGMQDAPPAGALGSPMLLQSRARLRIAQHRLEEAATDADAARCRWAELRVQHPVLASWRLEAAAALTGLGDRARAGELAREQVQLADRVGTRAPRAAALGALGRSGQTPDAVALLEAATGLAAESPAQLEHVRLLVAYGAALRRANQRAAAREPLRSALDIADRHGMRLLARQARTELRAAGARPRRPASTGPGSLTSAEHRVAGLAARGHSNRDIAGQLYVTRRTVETHLTHAFAKLGITSRAELADALARHQGPEPLGAWTGTDRGLRAAPPQRRRTPGRAGRHH